MSASSSKAGPRSPPLNGTALSLPVTNPFVAIVTAEAAARERAEREELERRSSTTPVESDTEDCNSLLYELDLEEILERAPVCFAVACFDYIAVNEDELALRQNDNVLVLSKDEQDTGDIGWWLGRIESGGLLRCGVFPQNYVIEVASAEALGSVEDHPVSLIEISKDKVVKLKPVGVGGFGKVYLGSFNSGPVAIKEMICTGVSERDLQHKCEELRREAELLAGFSHRNIARLYGIITTMPAVSLVMEYAAGGSLSTALQDNFLDQRVVLDWALQIAKGLNYLHNDSPTAVVHRDLKSQNVLLAKANIDGKAIIDGNTLKITDFGLARKFIKTTHESGTKGTFQWMAPESIRGGTYSKASDSWSYGVILWELLTSQSPYSGLPWETVAYMVGVGGSSLPIPSSCPRLFADLLEKCWSKVPTDRPGSAGCVLQLHDALRRLGAETSADVRLWNDMQLSWKDEMAERFKMLEKSEQEMCVQQSELRETQRRATIHQTELTIWETSLLKRAKDLQYREELSELMQTVAPVSSAPPTPAQKPPPVRRRTWRSSKRSGASSASTKGLSKLDISSPSDFKHVVHLPNGGGQKLQNFDGIDSPVLAGAMPVSTPEQLGRTQSNRELLCHTPPLMKSRSKSMLPPGGSSMAIGPLFRGVSDGVNGMSSESPAGGSSPLSPGGGSPLSSGSPLSPGGRSSRGSSGSSAETAVPAASTAGNQQPDRMQKSLSCTLETPTDFWGSLESAPVPAGQSHSSSSGNLIPRPPASTPGTPLPTARADARAPSYGDLSQSLPPTSGVGMAAEGGSPKTDGRRGKKSLRNLFRRTSNTSTSSHEHVEAWAEATGEGPAWHADSSIDWFYPMMSREDTHPFLQGRKPGAFVVRVSRSNANSLAISVMQENNKVWNGLIVPSSTGWRLGTIASAPAFRTPAMLIEFYTKLPYDDHRLLVRSASFDSPRRSLSAGEFVLQVSATEFLGSASVTDPRSLSP